MAKKKNGYWTRFAKSFLTWQGILILIATGLAWGYFLHSFDLIPDAVPVLGFLDDVVAVLLLSWGLWKFYNWATKK